jgi:protein-S-isoprenylcysteine O-methyltransferase Ste14
LYAIGFIGGFLTPTRLDGPLAGPIDEALAVNAVLILLFGLQHSIMARPWFKALWTRFVPFSVERSVYVLFTNATLALLFWQWRTLGGGIWHIQAPIPRAALWTLFGLGWLTVLVTTFLINHFDLFGLRQVWLYFRGRPYSHLPFVTPGPYRFVRHPLYVGWILAFWATPTMTAAHLVFAAGMTAYILIAIRFEERDLISAHAAYAAYRERTPMLVPGLSAGRALPEAPLAPQISLPAVGASAEQG